MAKDPAFLFYPKDWLQGTAALTPEEKGVYIDLLAHQHQEGSIPADTKRLARMVGLPESEFLTVWLTVRLKFYEAKDNRLVNRKLSEITTDRITKGLTNKISGTFAAVLRLSNLGDEVKHKIKKEFKINDFLTVPPETLTERLTTWLGDRLKSIGNANGNANTNVFKGGAGGKNEKLDSGTKFNENGELVFFSDGTFQKLGLEQRVAFQRNELRPNDIKRGVTY